MGYGGALMWTALARNLKMREPEKKVAFVWDQTWKDFKKGRNHPDHFIYKGNPDIDLILGTWLYEKIKPFLNPEKWTIVDMENPGYRYWTEDTPEIFHYRKGCHAVEYMAELHRITDPDLDPILILSAREKRKADLLMEEFGLKTNRFVCVEPHTTTFTPNKAWFWERWVELVGRLSEKFQADGKDWKIVQLGAGGGEILPGVISLTGRLTFREAGRVLEKASFLVSYEGGLVHLARAMRARSVVLISAYMPKEVAWYPENINFYTKLDCQGCGWKVPCPINRECMARITTDQVLDACCQLLV